MSTPKILFGYCPDEACKARISFSAFESTVECTCCGQQLQVDAIENVSEVNSRTLKMQTVLRTILNAANPNMKKGAEMVKVLGLSNYHCKLLSPLLTEHGMDKKSGKAKPLSEITHRTTFDCSVLSDRAFRIDARHLEIPGYGRDTSGSMVYLAGTLAHIKATNSNREVLVPIHADGDGHCLVHAVSRALVGRELFWHPLRTNLKQHIVDNIDQYKKLFQDFINAAEWTGIIEECDPEYEPLDESESLGLRNIHVFGLANVLRRPIILLDSVAGMKSSGDYSAVFLPVLVNPDLCRNKHRELNKPICLAWSSSAHNHYIPLVGIKGETLPKISRSLLPEVWAVHQALLDQYIDFDPWDCLVIGGDKSLQDSYIKKLSIAMGDLFYEKYGVTPELVSDMHHHCYKKIGLVGVTPNQMIVVTQNSANEGRINRCLECDALCVVPYATEWLRPGSHGLLYNLAVKHFGTLREDKIYSFHNYDLTCTYDVKRDRLVIDSPQQTDTCRWCNSRKLRLVHGDGFIAYENGDITKTPAPLRNRCPCGFKHWWDGQEYDNPPEMIPVTLKWSGRVVEERVPWFQYESDPMLNSNVFYIASQLVYKHFPGEFGSERLVQSVVTQILEQTNIDQDPEYADSMVNYGEFGAANYLGPKKPKKKTFEDSIPKPAQHRSFTKSATMTSSDYEYLTNSAESNQRKNDETDNASSPKAQKRKLDVASSTSMDLKVESTVTENPPNILDDNMNETDEEKTKKTQLELRNQQKDYIKRKEREYREQLREQEAPRPSKQFRPSFDLDLGSQDYAFQSRLYGSRARSGLPLDQHFRRPIPSQFESKRPSTSTATRERDLSSSRELLSSFLNILSYSKMHAANTPSTSRTLGTDAPSTSGTAFNKPTCSRNASESAGFSPGDSETSSDDDPSDFK